MVGSEKGTFLNILGSFIPVINFIPLYNCIKRTSTTATWKRIMSTGLLGLLGPIGFSACLINSRQETQDSTNIGRAYNLIINLISGSYIIESREIKLIKREYSYKYEDLKQQYPEVNDYNLEEVQTAYGSLTIEYMLKLMEILFQDAKMSNEIRGSLERIVQLKNIAELLSNSAPSLTPTSTKILTDILKYDMSQSSVRYNF